MEAAQYKTFAKHPLFAQLLRLFDKITITKLF